jgi:hypothetical protein
LSNTKSLRLEHWHSSPRIKSGLENTLQECAKLEKWVGELHERGETATFQIMEADENGNGGWNLDIICLETNNRYGGNGSYSTVFDTSDTVTHEIKDEKELEELVQTLRDTATTLWQTLADRED